MPTTIAGIKVDSLSIEEIKDKGSLKVTGSYSLISDKGKVLAKQSFNGYEQIEIEISQAILRAVIKEAEKAVSQTIGLEEV